MVTDFAETPVPGGLRKEFRRGREWWAPILLAAAAVLGVAVRGRPPELDLWLHAFAVHHRGGSAALARTLTQGGTTTVIWPMLVVAAAVFPRRGDPRPWLTRLAVLAAAGAGIGVRLLLSLALHRGRPPLADWAGTAGGYAFPSGHTTAATIGAGLLAWALHRHAGRRTARVLLVAAAVIYAGVVGWTRIWLGVHWPTDVVGGWLLGTGWLVLIAAVGRRFGLSRQTGTDT